MAKQIKAIKCPHCGSVDKTKLDKDLYHCESCNTDYFLDNDDININVTNTTHDRGSDSKFASYLNNKVYVFATCIVAIAFVFLVINSFISSRPAPPKYGTFSGSSPVTSKPTPTKPLPKEEDKPLNYRNKLIFDSYFLTDDNKLNVLELVSREFDTKYKKLDGVYYVIRDVITGKIIKSEQLKQGLPKRDDEWHGVRISDSVYYVICNSTFYSFDKTNFNFTDVTNSVINSHPEFVSGIATLNTFYNSDNDPVSFYILTNNGQQYLFYPSENKIFDYKEQQDENLSFLKELAAQNRSKNPTLIAEYRFVHLDGDSSNSPALIKVLYNAPVKFDDTMWINYDTNDQSYKVKFNTKNAQLVSDKILAKGRLFFEPKVVYGTIDQLLIKTKNNASPTAVYNLQSLDVDTGDVKWTIKGDPENDIDFYYLNAPLVYGDNYLILGVNRVLVISSVTGEYHLVKFAPEVIFEKDIK